MKGKPSIFKERNFMKHLKHVWTLGKEIFLQSRESFIRLLLTKKGSGTLKKYHWLAKSTLFFNWRDLLRYFFTSSDFLKFVEQLLFDPNFKVEFTEVNPEGEKYMIENRAKLFEFMKKKKVICAPSLLERWAKVIHLIFS